MSTPVLARGAQGSLLARAEGGKAVPKAPIRIVKLRPRPRDVPSPSPATTTRAVVTPSDVRVQIAARLATMTGDQLVLVELFTIALCAARLGDARPGSTR
jgi:hypothetical protein